MLRNLACNTSTPRRVPYDSPGREKVDATSPSTLPDVSFIIGSGSVEDPAPITERETIVRFSLDEDECDLGKKGDGKGKTVKKNAGIIRIEDHTKTAAQDIEGQCQCNDVSKQAQLKAQDLLNHSSHVQVAQIGKDDELTIDTLVKEVKQSTESENRTELSEIDSESFDSGLTSPSVEIERHEEYLFCDLLTCRSVIKVGLKKEEHNAVNTT